MEDKYSIDVNEVCQELYNTISDEHPGVRWVRGWQPILLGGKIDLVKRRDSEFQEYELTPKQVRKLFAERGWSRVVGFRASGDWPEKAWRLSCPLHHSKLRKNDGVFLSQR